MTAATLDAPTIPTNLDPAVERMLAQIEDHVLNDYTLADAMREGAKVTKQTVGWGNGDTACALTAAGIAAKARNYVR